MKPDCIIIDRESKKKCSIYPLVSRQDLVFRHSGTISSLPENCLDGYVFLHVDGKPLEPTDAGYPLLLLDASWKRALLLARLPALQRLAKRSIGKFITCYPRVSKQYAMPPMGLASVEAIYAAYLIQGREDVSLLDHYHWKEQFLQSNEQEILYWRNAWKGKKQSS
jgi:pre-rRNA-processing protein TSR3